MGVVGYTTPRLTTLGTRLVWLRGGDDSNSDILEREEHKSSKELDHIRPRMNTRKPTRFNDSL